jgi:hypothetical protein
MELVRHVSTTRTVACTTRTKMKTSIRQHHYSTQRTAVHHLTICPNEARLEVEVNLRPTVSRPVCLGVALPSGAHEQIFVFCLIIAGLLMWDTLSDKIIGL